MALAVRPNKARREIILPKYDMVALKTGLDRADYKGIGGACKKQKAAYPGTGPDRNAMEASGSREPGPHKKNRRLAAGGSRDFPKRGF